MIALLVTHAQEALREKLGIIVAELQALFPQEKFEVDSTETSEFLALHFSWYNRYAESVSVRLLLVGIHLNNMQQGEDAPVDIHPDQLRREGEWKVNILQRGPHEAREIREDPSLYRRVTECFADIFAFIHDNVSAILSAFSTF